MTDHSDDKPKPKRAVKVGGASGKKRKAPVLLDELGRELPPIPVARTAAERKKYGKEARLRAGKIARTKLNLILQAERDALDKRAKNIEHLAKLAPVIRRSHKAMAPPVLPEIQEPETPVPEARKKEYKALPTMLRFHASTAQIRAIVGSVGCYSGDTEFLSPNGWVRFDQFDGTQSVGQWDEKTKELSFVLPSADQFIKARCEEFIWFRNEHALSMMVSDEHRMGLYDQRGIFSERRASDVAQNPQSYSVPVNFVPTNPDDPISDAKLRVMVAFHAYGSIDLKEARQTIVLRKRRKRERIEQLLEAAEIPFTIEVSPQRPMEFRYRFVPPIQTKHYFKGSWWWKLSQRQLAIVLDEIQRRDGLFDEPERFYSTLKEDADFIQYAVHATGGRATISVQRHDNPKLADGYIVHIALPGSCKAKAMLRGDECSISRVPSQDGFKYCFVVPTGWLVVRHHDRVFISGNSGKTSAAAMEVCWYLPHMLAEEYGILSSKWVVIRNSYRELQDTTIKTIMHWFPDGDYKVGDNVYKLSFPGGIEVELLFRACDRPEDVKKFKSLELTGYWVDESNEVDGEIKRMIKNRIGRYPDWETWVKALQKHRPECKNLDKHAIAKLVEANPKRYLTKFGIETTNPPDVEHEMYSEFHWDNPPPGPVPEGQPKENHVGFWQPPGENSVNLTPGYYSDLRHAYRDNPDWVEIYIEGKPGIIAKGKLVYNRFRRDIHVAKAPLVWAGGVIFRGWDDSGNVPACVVVQEPRAQHIQVLKEFTSDKMVIGDFARWVIMTCNTCYPGATFVDWGDPAGDNKYSTRDGTFTSNRQLILEATGANVRSSDQNMTARISAVESALSAIDGILIDPGCHRLINGFLGGYHYKEIGQPGSQIYNDKPEKNRFSHVHDALAYVLVKLVKSSSAFSLAGWRPSRRRMRMR